MERRPWSEWQIVQLQECLINAIAPEETAALLGRTEIDVCAKTRELDLLFPPAFEESPPAAPALPNVLARRILAS
jgi:hypothetical protein